MPFPMFFWWKTVWPGAAKPNLHKFAVVGGAPPRDAADLWQSAQHKKPKAKECCMLMRYIIHCQGRFNIYVWLEISISPTLSKP